MTNYEIYVFVLCMVVFVLLTATFSYLITLYAKQELELIRTGQRDEQIRREYERKNSARYKAMRWAGRILSFVICMAFTVTFAFALYLRANDDKPVGDVPSVKVVRSSSMEEKNEKNKYLLENKLDDQIAMFDVILCEKLPAEEDLKLYDIVVYQQDDMYVIHRIIGIEEPNEEHPNERHFLLRGDAVEYSDKFPVLYSQMQGIYRGSHFPFVGSFIMFLQSPAGAMCMLLIAFAVIIAPIAESILEKARRERLGFAGEARERAALAAAAKLAENQRETRKRGMDIYYNRPGSPFSEPFQRQDQAIPYRHSQDLDYYSRYQEKEGLKKKKNIIGF